MLQASNSFQLASYVSKIKAISGNIVPAEEQSLVDETAAVSFYLLSTHDADRNWFSVRRKIVGKFASSSPTLVRLLTFYVHLHRHRITTEESFHTSQWNKERTIDFLHKARKFPKRKTQTQFSHVNFFALACQMIVWEAKINHLTLMSLTPKEKSTLCHSKAWMMSINASPRCFTPFHIHTQNWTFLHIRNFALTKTRLLFNWICPQIYFEMVI